jgi:CBS domain-containing protein
VGTGQQQTLCRGVCLETVPNALVCVKALLLVVFALEVLADEKVNVVPKVTREELNTRIKRPLEIEREGKLKGYITAGLLGCNGCHYIKEKHNIF